MSLEGEGREKRIWNVKYVKCDIATCEMLHVITDNMHCLQSDKELLQRNCNLHRYKMFHVCA